jgi:hypothetical protein
MAATIAVSVVITCKYRSKVDAHHNRSHLVQEERREGRNENIYVER